MIPFFVLGYDSFARAVLSVTIYAHLWELQLSCRNLVVSPTCIAIGNKALSRDS